MKYLLDANTYIQAKNQYYSLDFCPAYWDWLDKQFALGILGSVELVYDELKSFGDELSDWVADRKDHFEEVTDESTQQHFVAIATYLGANDFQPRNRDLFLGGADPWLIAKAKTIGATVVTHESLVGPESKKVKVPNVCRVFDVEFMNTFQLLRVLQAEFVLSP